MALQPDNPPEGGPGSPRLPLTEVADLLGGQLEGDEIVCPRHGARFCIKTGAVKSPPAYEDIECFPVQIIDGRVQVRDDRWD